jgi:LPXTG-motif cell wall-anchored protein
MEQAQKSENNSMKEVGTMMSLLISVGAIVVGGGIAFLILRRKNNKDD